MLHTSVPLHLKEEGTTVRHRHESCAHLLLRLTPCYLLSFLCPLWRQVVSYLGSPITGYGQESRNRAARQRISHKVWKDEEGVEKTLVGPTP